MPLRNPVTGQSHLAARYANLPTVGEYVPEREYYNNVAVSFSSTILNLTYFTAAITETITTATVATLGAAAATPTYCGMAVYSVAANGDLTQIAVTANDTTLFATANTAYAKAFTSSWSKVAGQRYAAGILVVSAAAMPTFMGQMLSATNPMVAQMLAAPTIAGRVLTQNDMTATTFASASVIGGQGRVGFKLT
jgi:hypothetical protein